MNDLKSHNPSSTKLQPLLVEWNDTGTDYPHDTSIHELFEARAEQNPGDTAVVFEDNKLTYAELNRRANQLAHYLRTQGIGPDVPVAILAERSCEMVVGWLGILKAGGAYVPMDPLYPGQRLALMLKDSKAPVVLTMASMKDRLPEYQGRILSLDSDADEFEKAPGTNPSVKVSATNLAYVIYTSGSTGEPKGVAVPHRAVNRLVCNTDYLQVEASDRVAQASNASFDAATFEIWGALLHGAQLVSIAHEMTLNPKAFADFLDRQRITVLFITTALFNQMARDVPKAFCGLRALLFGGEAVDPSWVRQVLSNGPPQRLLHVYGPTETTTFATWYEVKEVPEGALTVPIGIPIANTQAYILDRDLQPVSVGDPGELYLGGDGLAREYLNEPELTAERFIPDPFGDGRESRLYSTGDTVRFLSNGSIEFLGRIDDQVKIHGFRIEPGEIEAMLSLHPGIHETVVMVREDQRSEKRLVAYLVLAEQQQPSRADLRSFLKERLPDYMLPHAFMVLDNFPLTPNGKVNRRALPIPDWHKRDVDLEFVPPSTPIEEMLAGIWCEMLGVSQVSMDDNFFELGGHSLVASRFISRVRESLKVELLIQAIFEKPTVAELAKIIEKDHHGELSRQFSPIQPVSRDQELPLSCSQERVWFIQQLDTASIAYNFQATFRFKGLLNVTALEESLSEIVRRHEIFRTTFPAIDGRPVQIIHEARPVKLSIVNIQAFPESEREAKGQRLIKEEFQKPFDLNQLPLIRWTLLQLREEEYLLVHVEHHLVHDGWSFNVFLEELMELYKAYSRGNPSPLPELPVQFADFAYWQHQWMQGEEIEAQLTYWKKKLADSPTELQLPFDYPRAAAQSFKGGSLRLELPRDLCESLRDLSRKKATTLFMTMQTAFVTLLHRYSGQRDICVGAGVANRRWRETEGMIGMIINNVVLRTDLSGNPTFIKLLHRIREVTLEAYANQDVPFDKVVDAVQPVRDMSRNPLYQVMFGFHDSPLPALEFPGLTVDVMEGLSNESAKFDMTVVLIPRSEQHVGMSSKVVDEGITIIWEYNTGLFDKSTIIRMVDHYQTLLRGIVLDPGQPISDLPLLTKAERQQLLVEWNDSRTDYPRDSCIYELFEEQVERTPDAVAVVFGGIQITYMQLNARANQLAHQLRDLGVGPDVLVGICMKRSVEMVVGLLGILKAGGAYVPLDPEYPQERMAFMLSDTQVPVLLTQEGLAKELPKHETKVICLDAERETIARQSEANMPSPATAENLAYVNYTSGSTGRPKGICIPHRSVNRLVFNTNYVKLTPSDRIAQASTCSFDAATFEIWGALLQGARLVVIPKDLMLLPEDFVAQIREQEISALFLTTALFNQLARAVPRAFHSVRHLLFGGEAVDPQWVQEVLQHDPPKRLLHVYGPTESTTFASWYLVKEVPEGATTVPIGRPIANTQLYVLDHHLQPVPIGVPGELYIGGDGLARDYLNRPELTAEKFIPDPFNDVSGARLYKTGDLVRYLADGSIEFLGRLDQQVKIRGFRIELGEIEAVLGYHPAVEEVVVLAREDMPGDPSAPLRTGKRLVAYVVPSQGAGPTISELRSFLKKKLPDYMVPLIFVLLDSIPLTSNGKVDREALPVPDGTRPELDIDFTPPRTETEQSIAVMWREVLQVEDAGIHDDFFDLGGHSLLATRVMSRLRDQFQLDLPLSCFFEFPTIAGLARYVEATKWAVEGRKATSEKMVAKLEEGEI
jgi:amino acid adenylation domain-containing protein